MSNENAAPGTITFDPDDVGRSLVVAVPDPLQQIRGTSPTAERIMTALELRGEDTIKAFLAELCLEFDQLKEQREALPELVASAIKVELGRAFREAGARGLT